MSCARSSLVGRSPRTNPSPPPSSLVRPGPIKRQIRPRGLQRGHSRTALVLTWSSFSRAQSQRHPLSGNRPSFPSVLPRPSSLVLLPSSLPPSLPPSPLPRPSLLTPMPMPTPTASVARWSNVSALPPQRSKESCPGPVGLGLPNSHPSFANPLPLPPGSV